MLKGSRENGSIVFPFETLCSFSRIFPAAKSSMLFGVSKDSRLLGLKREKYWESAQLVSKRVAAMGSDAYDGGLWWMLLGWRRGTFL